MSELAAIAVGDRNQQISAIVGRAQLNFRDARKILADDVSVGTRGRTELVKVDLLVEIGVLNRTLIALRVAGVVEAGRIFVPGQVAARVGNWTRGTTSGRGLPVATSNTCTEPSSLPFQSV